MQPRRKASLAVVLIATTALVAATAGCAVGELEEPLDEQDQNSQTDNTADNQRDNSQDNTPQNDNRQNQPKQPEQFSETYQLCAAAGDTSGGQLEGLHCFAPHDVSGFEASDGDHTWQPGAFQVIAE